MKTLIATLFIIDFSGSMYQKIIDKSKHQVLQTKLSEMSTTYKSDIPIGVYSFGQPGNQSCQSLKFDQLKFAGMPKWLQAQKPGSYSKTPLARAIRQVATATNKYHFQQVVIVTDGADSCGEDPCQALQELSGKLEKQGTPVFLDLVGYDVKLNGKKLACPNFKGSRSLKYKFHKAESDAALSETLVQIDRKVKAQKAVNLLSAGQVEATEQFLSQKETEPQPPIPDGEAPGEGPSPGAPPPPPKPLLSLFSPELKYSEDHLSSVRILNPPSKRTFFAYQKGQLVKKWAGDFATILAPGDYTLRTIGKNKITQNLSIKIDPKQNKLVPYRLFLKDTTPHLIIQKTLFPMTIKPKVQGTSTDGLQLPETIVGENILPLKEGFWLLDIKYPWWLQKALHKEIRLSPGENRKINFLKVFNSAIQWVPHAKPGKSLALLVTTDFGKEMRILVPGHLKKIPILKEWDHHWIGL